MLPQPKVATAITPVSVTAAATATGAPIDTLGYRHCSIALVMTTSDNATNNPSVLKLQESHTTDATNFVDIAEAVGDSTSGFTIGNSVTSGQNNYLFQVSQLGVKRRRYLRVLTSPVTTQVIAGVALLNRAEEAPINATKANVINLVEI
jgi:hypothetical protein